MKKKGFTLIELLAVIVILAIIALIATPILMNVIENSRKGAAERSAENYLHAVEIAIMEARLDKEIEDGVYLINEDGSIQYNYTKINVNISADKITDGYVIIENGKVINATVKTKETSLIYDSEGFEEVNIWDGTIEKITKSEDGYHITTAGQLAWLSSQVSSGNTFSGEIIYLDADIDLNNIEWTPIGNKKANFNGTFEGNDHDIINMKISMPQENSDANKYLGLFGYSYGATIKDLTLINTNATGHSRIGALSGIARESIISNINVFNANISCVEYCGAMSGLINGNNVENKYIKDINSYYSSVKGESFVGVVIGSLTKTELVQNIYSNQSYVEGLQRIGGVIGNAENSKISTLYSNSTVNAENSTERLSAIGGLIGFTNNSSVDDLISEAIVIGKSDVGGIIGQLQINSKLTNSTSYAKVEGTDYVGGVIGICNAYESENTIENVKSYATVIGKSDVGGIIGFTSLGTTTVRNLYSKANITGEDKVGGIIGGFEEENATKLQYYNLVSESTLNTEYKPYNTLFGYKSAKTTLTQLNS